VIYLLNQILQGELWNASPEAVLPFCFVRWWLPVFDMLQEVKPLDREHLICTKFKEIALLKILHEALDLLSQRKYSVMFMICEFDYENHVTEYSK